MLLIVSLVAFLYIDKGSTDLTFLKRINFRKIFVREDKDKNLKGTFKSKLYLSSRVKISCLKNKSPAKYPSDFSWHHSGKAIVNSNHHSIDKIGGLTIGKISVEDSGEFICSFRNKSGSYKYKHEISVLQLPSKSLHVHFSYIVRSCTQENEESARILVESKVKPNTCQRNECTLSNIHSSCNVQKFANPSVRVTVPIVLSEVPNKACNTECSRRNLDIRKEEVKQRVISTVMRGKRLKIREESEAMPISYLETQEDNICDPGFEMKGSQSRSLCMPCSPGHFLEKGYCIPCHLNQYNGKYGATECRSCFGRRITRSRGSTSEEDCMVADVAIFWIVVAIGIISVPFILICFCWGILKLVRESVLTACCGICYSFLKCEGKIFKRNKFETNKRKLSKSYTSTGLTKENAHSRKISKSPNETSSISSFVIPSVRLSSARDYFDNVPHSSSSRSLIPRPPAMPTDSMLKQTTRNTEPSVLTRDFSRTKQHERENRNPTPMNQLKDRSPETFNGISRYYMKRIPKNTPMHNAILKSKL